LKYETFPRDPPALAKGRAICYFSPLPFLAERLKREDDREIFSGFAGRELDLRRWMGHGGRFAAARAG
jgi:hypothetical protein